VKESGIDLENENLKKFRIEIKNGDWDKVTPSFSYFF